MIPVGLFGDVHSLASGLLNNTQSIPSQSLAGPSLTSLNLEAFVWSNKNNSQLSLAPPN